MQAAGCAEVLLVCWKQHGNIDAELSGTLWLQHTVSTLEGATTIDKINGSFAAAPTQVLPAVSQKCAAANANEHAPSESQMQLPAVS